MTDAAAAAASEGSHPDESHHRLPAVEALAAALRRGAISHVLSSGMDEDLGFLGGEAHGSGEFHEVSREFGSAGLSSSSRLSRESAGSGPVTLESLSAAAAS
mmetsp:Transcript_144330/g.461356  ORF Transcript_144330/g.461356 Transcript_144330/m.461356 type:complete len:102 (-) Transcript_144330:155-460(-)|eukprot:CAMPEP_0204213756 /NCGR_PEP_ID=MMETSP0361-20130328/76236_1 /ASSEMBLY_ACC=CAM_ASM_000343 /TAXON_ID=268821 /ORGANISM="Scrippsiella Hangoei, Strain SHTV-5" /LENGTH=101 /DNA_ID=CAMNT_0051178279 /DNA_START=81 /DNA_END=386 /DNA_ORIENTATION=+